MHLKTKFIKPIVLIRKLRHSINKKEVGD